MPLTVRTPGLVDEIALGLGSCKPKHPTDVVDVHEIVLHVAPMSIKEVAVGFIPPKLMPCSDTEPPSVSGTLGGLNNVSTAESNVNAETVVPTTPEIVIEMPWLWSLHPTLRSATKKTADVVLVHADEPTGRCRSDADGHKSTEPKLTPNIVV